ncbi:CHL1 isoform 5 [Pongo abelii]|uniref:CHL1 isoform 5 n=1 Tax=Pongo abelii TaxID=9601 RepID=A0A2J8WE97_PONAB|nr:CHL1 isoform 5 [Pongo abelii]
MPPAWKGGINGPPPRGREGRPGALVAMAPGSGARGARDASHGWSLLPLCASLFLSLFFFFFLSVSVRGEAARRK